MTERISLSGKYLDYHDDDAEDDNAKDEKFWGDGTDDKEDGDHEKL